MQRAAWVVRRLAAKHHAGALIRLLRGQLHLPGLTLGLGALDLAELDLAPLDSHGHRAAEYRLAPARFQVTEHEQIIRLEPDHLSGSQIIHELDA